ncbi:hypothetical protein G1K66_12920 [Tenacibaculum finnmarkense]|uniref:hypothetical protein n=1 Tax=Tenacibaculum finnmarkense TaxID=2781243 RepID=UPI001E62A481|nr:hypothetical protein [Tenacibaculum finnmarkense]MCD8415960.1 hypothetical protein [Tenacibaculum dicentrarchi]MCD8421090.1 hypothetical protein [Tenacibaculum dicentrarchi]MCG8814156.1 hypothetical protein [Tenacibaculum finnmarkense]
MYIFISNNKAYILVLLGLCAWYLFLFIFNGKKNLSTKKNNNIKNIKKTGDNKQIFNNLAEGEIEEEDYPMTNDRIFKTEDLDADNQDWSSALEELKEQQSKIKNSNELNDLLGDIGISRNNE